MSLKDFISNAGLRWAFLAILFASAPLTIPDPLGVKEAKNGMPNERRLAWIKAAGATNAQPLFELSWVRTSPIGKFESAVRVIVHLGEPFWFESQSVGNTA